MTKNEAPKPTLADAIAWARSKPCQACGAKSEGVHKSDAGKILILCGPCGRARENAQ